MLMKPDEFPLLDLYLEFSNDCDIKRYKEVISDFVALWGVDVHIFFENLQCCNRLDELLEILENSGLNTYSFYDGVMNRSVNYNELNLIKYCADRKVNAISIPINVELIKNKQYIEYLRSIKKIIKLEVYLKVNKSNIKDFYKVIEFCNKEDVKLCILDIDKKSIPEQRIKYEEYGSLVEEVRKINAQNRVRISIAECPYLNAIEKKTLNNALGGCAGGLTSCFVKANGDVVPCIYLPQVVVGNVNSKRLVEIWKKSEVFLKLRDRLNITGKCKKCQYLMSCGGCRAESYFKYNDLFYEDNNCWLV